MTRSSTTCSNCGHEASGNFCRSCGAALKGAPCPECNAQLKPGALYCHSCSHDLRARRSTKLYWLLFTASAVTGVVLIVAALRMGSEPISTHPTVPILPPRTAATAQPYRPLQEADQFFDRAMRAYERGDSEQATFTGRIALEAYATLDSLDADARFHVGLLHQIAGDYEAILAQADTIGLDTPTHLFALLLRDRVYLARGNDELVADNYVRFLEQYDSEIALGRPEYELHSTLLDTFRRRAGAR
jgi:hypothetical protein